MTLDSLHTITTVVEMRALSDAARRDGQRITFFPTMGFLHAGHASLIRWTRRDGDVVVVSLFVNPTQFGPKEDFASYQRDFDRDRELINNCGGDVPFPPTIDEMYPEGFSAFVDVDALTETFCGASRPGHFKGVATIVTKLFTSVRPHAAVFGQKDAQQALLIKRHTRDLNLGVEILVSPTVRESDGLARSSRNVYLTEEERSVHRCCSTRFRRVAVSFWTGYWNGTGFWIGCAKWLKAGQAWRSVMWKLSIRIRWLSDLVLRADPAGCRSKVREGETHR